MDLNLILEDVVSALKSAKSTRDGNSHPNPYAGFASKLRPEETVFYKQRAMHARYFQGGEISSIDLTTYALSLGIMPSDRMFYECFYFNLLNRIVSKREIYKGINSRDINEQILPNIEKTITKTGISNMNMQGFPEDCNFVHDIKEFVVAALTGISDENQFEITGLNDGAIQWLYEYSNTEKELIVSMRHKNRVLLKDGTLRDLPKT